MKKFLVFLAFFFVLLFGLWSVAIHFLKDRFEDAFFEEKPGEGIKPGSHYLQYWTWNGKPVMLLGGSVEDNLFQIDTLTAHLDRLQAAGGNYVRNTLSCRDEGNVWPFLQLENGLYDLRQWNDEYWRRLEFLYEETQKRDIVVQIEIWATFDFYREPWTQNPFNPVNNINYDSVITRLPSRIPSHPIYTQNPFFRSVPEADAYLRLLGYQQLFVDKLMDLSLRYNHILYCMDNETSVTALWGKYWAQYIKKLAEEQGKTIYTTEMWDPHDLGHIVHRETFDHPEIYDFVEISQNNHNRGDLHWNNGLVQIERLQKRNVLRPANNVKVYGRDGGPHKDSQHGIECFIRNVLFGAASSRFHRPPTGLGLSDTAYHVIKSMRACIEYSDFFNGQPMNALLIEREENSSWCRAIPGKEYMIYMNGSTEALLDLSSSSGYMYVHWINLITTQPGDSERINASENLRLISPGEGHWMAIITKNRNNIQVKT